MLFCIMLNLIQKASNHAKKVFVSSRENELFPARHEEMSHGWTLPRWGGGRGRRRRRAGLVPGHPAGTGPGTERAAVPKSRRPTTEVTTELIREEWPSGHRSTFKFIITLCNKEVLSHCNRDLHDCNMKSEMIFTKLLFANNRFLVIKQPNADTFLGQA